MSNRKILAIIVAILITVFAGSCTAAKTNPAGNRVLHFNATDGVALQKRTATPCHYQRIRAIIQIRLFLPIYKHTTLLFFAKLPLLQNILIFLASFNDEKPEIVNITIQTPTYMSNHYHYMIICKNKSA